MGKNGKFGKDYGKVVGKDSASRPGWKGPGFTKKAEPKPKKSKPEAEKDVAINSASIIPLDLQQLLLNIFKDTFSEVIDSDTFRQVLQDVKGALYERDFTRAFGNEEFLEVYSARWSPGRSLCYTAILAHLQEHMRQIFPRDGNSQVKGDLQAADNMTTVSKSKPRVVSFGGGAAEIVAFGGILKYLTNSSVIPEINSDSIDDAMSSLSLSSSKSAIDLVLVDTASWANVVGKLQTSLTTPPPLSKYASAAAREANSALIESDQLTATFIEKDVLAMTPAELGDMAGKDPILVTLFFTLNELYTTSISKTTAFLLNLTSVLPSNSLLLVVDSPGSYSETKVGTEEKKYPMKFLLDHTLLETQKSRGHESKADWEKVHSEDSQWFRLSEDLRFPIALENMRYQVHLYRRS